ncbi:DinB family protein [Lunatibacter salilacus]|uniref:DinB family protein n=1 Tax=Lunatibacter salilacus TaxID=2483804 RepID=UPI00131EAAC2|nr:DinB family protein [Lunatibacter salilacus]
MNKPFLSFLTVLLIAPLYTAYTQDDPFLRDFLQRWKSSKEYMVAVAEAMPEDAYGFKPVTEEMTFAEQLMHIAVVIEWHTFSRFGGLDTPFRSDEFRLDSRSKDEVIRVMVAEFDKAADFIKQFDPGRLDETNTYSEFTRSRRQFLMLLADHVTHHRGQLLVYLRLKGIKPPNYIQFQ